MRGKTCKRLGSGSILPNLDDVAKMLIGLPVKDENGVIVGEIISAEVDGDCVMYETNYIQSSRQRANE